MKEIYIIPTPKEFNLTGKSFTIEFDHRIIIDASCGEDALFCARLLQDELLSCAGFSIAITRGFSKKPGITLRLSKDKAKSPEGYYILCRDEGIIIEGYDRRSLIYGVQTLRQIIRQRGAVIPCLEICDFPDIKNRGFYHDVTRGRVPTLPYLKSLADRLSFYKQNQLQLYIEHTFLFEDFSEVWRDDTPLTPQDILELDEHCKRLGIDLVPSISCFGHLYKVLRTRQYEDLCELDSPAAAPFGFIDRMLHHTLDVSNPGSFDLVLSMIEEYLPLFSSNHFNICCDETFDLGKGKNAAKAQELGNRRLYIDFVKKIADVAVSKGKIPMFWGDIICDFPDAIRELPAETICLNWGYDRDVDEKSTAGLSAAGANIYCCPGVCGWNRLINLFEDSYHNIRRMSLYAGKYKALGILNTDWGDYGHINHPDFSIPGMIYGAAFSWNKDVPDFEELNRRISVVEYKDKTGRLVGLLDEASRCQIFTWYDAVQYKEAGKDAWDFIFGADDSSNADDSSRADNFSSADNIPAALERLSSASDGLRSIACDVPDGSKAFISSALIAIRGIELLNKTALALIGAPEKSSRNALASGLEEWFMYYKEAWRRVSRESELSKIGDVIFYFADLLRA